MKLYHLLGLVALVVVTAVVSGCTRPDEAREQLTKAGYTNIETGGYSFFGCSEDDTFKTKFKAKGPTGIPVEGTVCSGVFKGATIRLN